MRLIKTLKNSIASVIAYVIIAILSFEIRKVFLLYIDDVFLGYEGFFANVFEVLSVLGLGIDTVVTYKIVKAYGENKTDEISDLFDILLYFIVRIILLIGVLSFLVFVICGYVVKNISIQPYVLSIFILLLIQFCIQQMINAYRIIFIVSQVDYKFIKIDVLVQMICAIIKLYAIVYYNSYLFYAIVSCVACGITFCIIKLSVYKTYPFLRKCIKVDKKVVDKYNLISEIKHNSTQKIALAIYGGTDYVVMSIIFGIKTIAVFSNFYLLANSVNNALCKLFDPVQPAIGNLMYTDDKPNYNIFNMFNFCGFVIGIYMFGISYIGLNSFVLLFFGEKYVVDRLFVLFYSINIFIGWNHKFLAYYRNNLGGYSIDRSFIVLGAVLNILLSIICTSFLGVAGIMLGTLVGHLGFWVGRVLVVYRLYIKTSIKKYLITQIKYISILLFEVLLMLKLFYKIPSNWLEFLMSLIFTFIINTIVVIVGILITGEFRHVKKYIKLLWDIVRLK